MTVVFTDEQVADRTDPAMAVAAMREAILAAETGTLACPPRISAPLGSGRLVVTAGRLAGRWYGFRSYASGFGHAETDQLVVLHDGDTGRLRAIAVGVELGVRRTGAIGAVAVHALARPDAARLAVVGAGRQAWTQVWAAAAVRRLAEVAVFSPTATRREAFAGRVRTELGVAARATGSAAEAVADRDLVILATTSPEPVIDAAVLAPGTHVNTVGFKQQGRAEFAVDLLERSSLIATDSLAQVSAYDPPMLLAGTGHADRMVSLGAILSGTVPGRRHSDEITLFCSVGLAGTEVFLLDRLVTDQADQQPH